MSAKRWAWVCDYIIRKTDGSHEFGTASFTAPDIFGAMEQAKNMVEDYNLQNPEEDARVLDIGLVAEFGPEDLFEEEEES